MIKLLTEHKNIDYTIMAQRKFKRSRQRNRARKNRTRKNRAREQKGGVGNRHHRAKTDKEEKEQIQAAILKSMKGKVEENELMEAVKLKSMKLEK